MKIAKKFFAILLVIALAVVFTGCDGIFASPSEVVTPPKLAGALAGLDDALDKTLKEKYEFAYPSAGEYRSSCITKDLNGDGLSEAIVFYILESDNMLHMNTFTYKDGTWTSISDIDLQSSGVERVAFENLQGDKNPEVIISSLLYSSTDNRTHQANVFSYEQNGLEMRFQENCTDFAICDMLGNGYKQIMCFNVGDGLAKTGASAAQTATAKLMGVSDKGDGKSVFYGESPMDPDISSVALTTQGKVDNNPALYVDSNLASGSMITSLLIYNQKTKKLANALYDKVTANNNVSLRFAPITSRDFDDDGVIEIPVSHLATNEENKSDNMMLSWTSYSGGKLTVKSTGFYNSIYNYFFGVNEKWATGVVVESKNDGTEMVYSVSPTATADAGKKLLTVIVKPHEQDETVNNGSKPTYSNDDYDFWIVIDSNIPKTYAQSEKTILDSFKVIK